MPVMKRADGSSYFGLSVLLILVAFVFFLVAALKAGGIISGLGPWLVPAGLASYMLALLVP